MFSEVESAKSQKEIMQEIQAIIRQITASVTFLPLLSEQCCFDLLVYADNDATVPLLWEDSDPCFIQNCEEVRLRSFTTKVFSVLLCYSIFYHYHYFLYFVDIYFYSYCFCFLIILILKINILIT
jgi:hypothetical protein